MLRTARSPGTIGSAEAPERWRCFAIAYRKNNRIYFVAMHGLSSVKGAEQATGYHGEVGIDPASGTILFLTLQADQLLGSPILRSDIMVEYGPVELGGKMYTCPIRSVAIGLDSMDFMGAYPFGRPTSTSNATLLNDVTFEGYHLFRADARILTGNIPAPDR